MQSRTRFVLAMVLGGIVAGSVLGLARPAVSNQSQPSAPAPRWDYYTETVEFPSLQAKLTELGQSGWEIFSLNRQVQIVDPGTAEGTRLRVLKYQVTARKRMD